MKIGIAILAAYLMYHTWHIAKGYWQEKERPAGIFLMLLIALFPILTVFFIVRN